MHRYIMVYYGRSRREKQLGQNNADIIRGSLDLANYRQTVMTLFNDIFEEYAHL